MNNTRQLPKLQPKTFSPDEMAMLALGRMGYAVHIGDGYRDALAAGGEPEEGSRKRWKSLR